MGMWRQRLRQIRAAYEDFYRLQQRQMLGRQARQEDDLFRLLAMSESLGIMNPAAFYTLELIPFLLQDYHHWHRRMGMERSPSEGFRCC